jgi:hypothetical protein
MGLDDRLRRERQASMQPPMEGAVVETPPSIDEPLRITLDAYGHRRQHEAYGWAPRASTDPAPGDTVWVLRADSGILVVLTWATST